jgi:ElaB/YqjD/DUF883 family membrane-anchored ribosome-binding protein
MSETNMVHSNNGPHLKESAVAVKDAVADLASETGRYAKQRLGMARESASAMLATAKDKAQSVNSEVVSFIRQRPYTSVAIAAGIGLTLGLLLRRRR